MTISNSIPADCNVAMEVPMVSGTCSATTVERQAGESQAYFAALLQSSIDAIVIIDERGRIVEFNPAAESMFGYARANAIGRKLSELVIPAPLRERHEAGFRRYVETGVSSIVGQHIEMPAIRADGKEFPVELSVMGASQGGRRFFTAFIRDLTKRKLAALNHERLNVIVDASEDAVISQDLNGTILTWNAAAERMYGYSAQETVGQSTALLVPASHQEELANTLARIKSGECIKELETIRLHKDGHLFDVSLSISPIRDGHGQIVGASKIAKSITERKWLETRLRLEQRALDQISEGIFFTDPTLPDNPIVYVNPAFERITGYKSVDIQGRNCELLSGAKKDQQALARLQNAIEDRQPCAVELLNYRADGEAFWSSISITPMFDFAGQVTHFVGVLSDVTRRHALEEQLRQSQKMDALGRLAGGIAHDFNNILTVILGNVEFALDELDELPRDNRQLIDWVREIGEAARRAAELTKQVLVFSRKQSVEPRCVSLNEIVSNLDKLLRRLIGEDVRLVVKLSPALGWIKADVGQLEQVLMNLVVNARDAMPMGGTLTIETTNVNVDCELAASFPDLPPGAYVKLSMSDTGCGMSADVLSRVFEPFFTTKMPGQGTGMGLATVFGIVKQSNGHISAQSEPGRGSTFHLFFPRTDNVAELLPSCEPSQTVLRGAERILLVEDDPQLRRLASLFLRSAGYEILEAGDGPQALQLAKECEGRIDLLITDVIMPAMNGRDVAEELQTFHSDCKALFISGYTLDGLAKRGMFQEGVPFLQKPFDQPTLTAKVRELLDSQPMEASLRHTVDIAK